ncbi:MAG: T9SS type A sorting domain-containing protein [Prevotellaceae bacterium]|jgi:hypothetical protein|nr:T9SS type A sorting domain-containing protein [Prevotellaceae bacterium]
MKNFLQKKHWKIWLMSFALALFSTNGYADIAYPLGQTQASLSARPIINGGAQLGNGNGETNGTTILAVGTFTDAGDYFTFNSATITGIGGHTDNGTLNGNGNNDNSGSVRFNYVTMRIRLSSVGADYSTFKFGVFVDGGNMVEGTNNKLYSLWTSNGTTSVPALTNSWQWVVIKTESPFGTGGIRDVAWMRYWFTNAQNIEISDMYISENRPVYGPPEEAPNITAVSQNLTTISVTWPAVAGATQYDVYRGGVFQQTVSTNSYSDTGLSAQEYCYTVKAKNDYGPYNVFSNESCATPAPHVAKTYYSASNSGNLAHTLTYWWTNTNATGNQPSSFTDGDIFIVQAGHGASTNADGWVVSGEGSEIRVNGTLTVKNNATLPKVVNVGTFNITTDGKTITIDGDLETTGTFTIQNNTVVTITGNFKKTANTFTYNSGNDAARLNIGGYFSNTGGSVTISGNQQITITGNFTNSANFTYSSNSTNAKLNIGGYFSHTNGTFTVSNNQKITIAGNFTNSATFNYNSDSGTDAKMFIGGNLNNTGGTFNTNNNNTVILNGTGEQHIQGNVITFRNLRIRTDNTVYLDAASLTIYQGYGLFLDKGVFNVGATHIVYAANSNTVTIDARGGTLDGVACAGGSFADGSAAGSIVSKSNGGNAIQVYGKGTVGSPTFYNIYSDNGGNYKLNLQTAGVLINGTLASGNLEGTTGNGSWAVQTNSPVYGPNSKLVINRGGSNLNADAANIVMAWVRMASGNIGTTPGYPNNVTLVNMGTNSQGNGYDSGRDGTTGAFGLKFGGTWSLEGTLQIGLSGTSAGYIDFNNSAKANTVNLTCGGFNFQNGKFAAPGGSFIVKGDWTKTANGTYYSNDATVTFAGTGTITSNTENVFHKLAFAEGANISLGSSIGTTNQFSLTGNATLNLATGTNRLTLNTATAPAFTAGKKLTVTNWATIPEHEGTAGRLFFGTSETLTPDQLSQIKFMVGGKELNAMQLAAGEVVPEFPCPVVLPVSGSTAAVCAPNTVAITLTGETEAGAIYYLYNGATEVPSSNQTGNGGNLIWNASASGTYTVKALGDGETLCPRYTDMSGSVVVTINAPVSGTAAAVNGTIGNGATETINLTDYTGNIQWEYNNGGTWENATGTNTTSASFTTNALGTGNYTYRAKVYIGECVVYSDNVAITVQPCTAIPPADVLGAGTYCEGSTVQITSTSAAAGATYALYKGDVYSGINYIGTLGGTLTWTISDAPVSAAGTYTVRATNDGTDFCEGTVILGTAVVEITPFVSISAQPAASTVINKGNPVTLSVTAANATSYQWYQCDDALKTNPQIIGTSSASYGVTVSAVGIFYYYCVANGCGDSSAESDVAVVTINDVNEDNFSCTPVSTVYMLFNNFSGRYAYENASNIITLSNTQYVTDRPVNGNPNEWGYIAGSRSSDYPTATANPEYYWVVSQTPNTDNWATWINVKTGRYLTLDKNTAAEGEGRRAISTATADGNNSNWKFYGANNADELGTFFMNQNTALDNKNPNYANAEPSCSNGTGHTEANRKIFIGGGSNDASRGTKGWYVHSEPNPKDLQVLSVTVDESIVTLNNDGVHPYTFTATATIKNGTMPIPSGTSIKINFEFNGQYYYAYHTTGLTANQEIEIPVVIDPAFVALTGAPVTVTVNSDNNIANESNCANNILSSSNVLVVYEILCSTPTLSGVTASFSQCGTANANLSAATTGGVVKWYNAENGGSPLYTGTTYNAPLVAGVNNFWAAAEDGDCKSARQQVTVTTYAAPATGTAAAAATVPDGSAATVTLTGNGDGTTIQWQILNGTWQDLAGKTTSPLTTDVFANAEIGNTYQYRAAVSNGVCAVEYSNIVSVTVIDHTTIEPAGSCNLFTPCNEAGIVQASGAITPAASAGTSSSIWDDAPFIDIAYRYTYEPTPTADAPDTVAGRWQVLYDATNLYFKVESFEEVARNAGGNIWDGSSIELDFWFGDLSTENGQNIIGYNAHLLGSGNCNGAGEHVIRDWTGNKHLKGNYAITAYDLDGGGYIMELAIPWSVFPAGYYDEVSENGIQMELMMNYGNKTPVMSTDNSCNGGNDLYISRAGMYRSFGNDNFQFRNGLEISAFPDPIPLTLPCVSAAPDLLISAISYTAVGGNVNITSVELQNDGDADVNPSLTPIQLKFELEGQWRTATINSSDVLPAENSHAYTISVAYTVANEDAELTITATVYGIEESICTNNTDDFDIIVTKNAVGFENPYTNIVVYPNPVQDIFYISGIADSANVVITNILGKVVYNGQYNGQLNVAYLPQGIYLVKTGDKIAKITKK